MNKYLAVIVITIILGLMCAAKVVGVRGTIRKSGKYSAPHYKTSPNKVKIDNWSTKGNINPFTEKKGYKKTY
jgi:hypothetical protein